MNMHSPNWPASTTVTATVKLTPIMLARALWAMGSDEQTQFLHELAQVIQTDHAAGNTSAYSLGELQWFVLGAELLQDENKLARDVLMSMAAPLYLHTLRACGELV